MSTLTVNGHCSSAMEGTLVRPVARYPSSVVTDAWLKVASNRVQASLARAIGAGDTEIQVGDGSRIVADMLLSIDSEIVSVTSVSGNILTVVRGYDGTVATSHGAGRTAAANIVAWHHNSLVAEIEAIENALGPNLSNIGGGENSPFVYAAMYDFTAQVPGGSLTVGANVVTLTPVPRGVNGTNKHHWLWIDQGTGTPEACEIIGGTAVSGAASGTVIVLCAWAHSGSWRIGSATGGIREALEICRHVAETRRTVVIHAPIWVDSAREIYGAPIWGTEIQQASQNTDCIWIGDDGPVQTVTCVISGLTFITTSAAWTSGWAINVRHAGYVEIRDCFVYGNNLIWGGINLYRAIRANLWNNYIHITRSHGIFIHGQDAVTANQSIDCNIIHNEFAFIQGNPIRVGDWTQGLSFRDCIFNNCITNGIHLEPSAFTSGVNLNYFISECDIEGAGVYATNCSNIQMVNNWLSGSPVLNSVKLTSTVDTALISANLITGGGGAGTVPVIDTDAKNVLITGNSINGGGAVAMPVIINVGPNARDSSIMANFIMIGETCIQIDAAARDTTVAGNTFTRMTTAISGKGVSRHISGNKGIDDVQAAGMAPAATISPLNPVQLIVGTGAINTITVPDGFSGKLTLLPVNGFTWTNTGNIFAAGTAIPGRAVEFTWDTVDSKWWPSYL